MTGDDVMKLKQSNLFWIVLFVMGVAIFSVFSMRFLSSYKGRSTQTELYIPPILEDLNPEAENNLYLLTTNEGTMEFISGKMTKTLGFNGAYLGPTIMLNSKDKIKVKVNNLLDEATTVHWHGLIIPGESDGGPHQVIHPNGEWETEFQIIQPAATTWYHPHGWQSTASQVYRGLAGLLIIDDEISRNLNLPSDYGINDIPIIIQDRSFNREGQFIRSRRMMMSRKQEDFLLVNGSIHPFVQVSSSKIRLRVINASNEMNMRISLSQKLPVFQIASDGGLLTMPVQRTTVFLAPAERVELVVDFSGRKKGEKVELNVQNQGVLTFIISNEVEDDTEIPDSLVTIKEIDLETKLPKREFILGSMGANFHINGKSFEIDRIDEIGTVNTTEIWEISVKDHMMMSSQGHPFHIHGTQFRIVSRNNQIPEAYEQGWKDTVFIRNNETVQLLVQFHYPGVYMYHCHILEHEENGMMGQVLIEESD